MFRCKDGKYEIIQQGMIEELNIPILNVLDVAIVSKDEPKKQTTIPHKPLFPANYETKEETQKKRRFR